MVFKQSSVEADNSVAGNGTRKRETGYKYLSQRPKRRNLDRKEEQKKAQERDVL